MTPPCGCQVPGSWGRRRRRRLVRWAGLLALTGMASACGGGGGGGGSAGARPASFFETTEYRANRGLDVLGASSAYAAGATGQGVRVAVIDTGVDLDHPELAGRILGASTDIVSGDPAQVNDIDGHGTAVAGVIVARRNQELSHGVAFEAGLLAVRADSAGSCASGCAFEQSDVAAATDYAVAHGARVINYSLGGASSLGARLSTALADAVDAGAILVFAAGNDGAAEPTLPGGFAASGAAAGQAIAVGAVDAGGQLASFSNAAGSAREQFLVAPGVGILAPELGGGAALVSGTSFAAPHVSGAAALVLDAAPFLSAAEVVELLLESASDLGAPGTDAVYGRGLVDLTAALGPQGPLGFPLGATVDADSAALESSALQLGPAFGAGPELGRAIFLDGYGRPYWLDLDDRVQASAPGPALERWLRQDGRRPSARRMALGRGLAIAIADDAGAAASGLAGAAAPAAGEAFEVELLLGGQGSPRSGRLALSRGFGLQHRFGLLSLEPQAAGGLISEGAFASPYLALADRGDGLVLAQRLGGGTSLRVGIARATDSRQEPFAQAQQALAVGELVQSFGAGGALGLQLGTVEEQQSLLDSRSGGALALADAATTTFAGITARWALGPRLALFGQGSVGLTEPGGGAGLFEDVSVLRSTSFAAGLSGRALLAAGDRLTLAVAQPLRVEAGSASFARPVGRSFEGQILRQSERVDLAPDGRELDLELGYRLALGARREVSFNWLTRLEPGHRPDADPDHAVAVRLRSRF